ncbi:MAG TPA: MJ0042-type zinc finger domain-containing protein [Tepidisphaeraceae bacterium]|nr:MJ0042-type zinc finger domain-containing protein [Tepidisphaeraceae bacterium]
MSLPLTCPTCAHAYRVNDRLAGKRVKCKACGAVIAVAPVTTTAQAPKHGNAAASQAHGFIRGTSVQSPAPGDAQRKSKDARRHRESDSTGVRPVIPETTPKPAKKSEPGAALRRLYAAIAVCAVLGFGAFVYLMGRELGLWGESRPSRRVVIDDRPLTPAEQLDRDRHVSSANLERLGNALELWARQHKGLYPRRLADVADVAELPVGTLKSPFATDDRAESYRYLFVRSLGVSVGRDTVLAYDAAELAAGAGTNVLYGNGDVRWVAAADLPTEIRKSEDARLGLATTPRQQ